MYDACISPLLVITAVLFCAVAEGRHCNSQRIPKGNFRPGGIYKECSTLDLGGTNLNDNDILRLVTALEGTKLTTLDLGYNKIGPEGAHAIANVLSEMPQLTTLVLGFNKIGPDGARS